MWCEIYPKASGNHNPRAISIIDSTRFKTPSVDLPLVPQDGLVVSPTPALARSGPSCVHCGSFYSLLVDGRDDCHVGNLWSPQMPFEIRPIGWATADTCHASFATFTSSREQPLDYSPDNILRRRDKSRHKRNRVIFGNCALQKTRRNFFYKRTTQNYKINFNKIKDHKNQFQFYAFFLNKNVQKLSFNEI